MKRSILVMITAVVMVGCSHNQTVQAPVNKSVVPPTEADCPKPSGDNFDKAGGMFADGSRYVWNETTKAYEWTAETIQKFNEEYNTEQNRKKLSDKTHELIKAMKEAVEK